MIYVTLGEGGRDLRKHNSLANGYHVPKAPPDTQETPLRPSDEELHLHNMIRAIARLERRARYIASFGFVLTGGLAMVNALWPFAPAWVGVVAVIIATLPVVMWGVCFGDLMGRSQAQQLWAEAENRRAVEETRQ